MYEAHPEFGELKIQRTMRAALREAGLQEYLRTTITKILLEYVSPSQTDS